MLLGSDTINIFLLHDPTITGTGWDDGNRYYFICWRCAEELVSIRLVAALTASTNIIDRIARVIYLANTWRNINQLNYWKFRW